MGITVLLRGDFLTAHSRESLDHQGDNCRINDWVSMTYAATYIYWAIVALWLTVLSSVVYYYVRNPRAFGPTRLLLTVIGIDTVRNIAENIYFGLYFGGAYGLFPHWTTEVLGRPELLILPKITNVAAGCVVLGLLLFHWLPLAVRDWKRSEERVRDLQTLAAIDPLTGLYNRRQFETLARAELARCRRYMRPCAFLMIDIDNFKGVNDSFGHEMGDWVLKMVATTLASARRDADVVARFGGEEFVIMLPETALGAATMVAERIRSMVSANALAIGESKQFLTISVGVGEATASSPSVEAVLRYADRALYEAKQTGRNRVCVAKPPLESVAYAAE
jgi:diguanylate cyclase (GGDEF)-like protein